MNLLQLRQIIKNMGWRYCLFRFDYELKRKTGLLKRKYPTFCYPRNFISLAEWKNIDNFFFQSRESLEPPKRREDKLEREFNRIVHGEFCYFSSLWFNFDRDWATNPETGYKYDNTVHWTEIEDMDKTSGDIKYVWEKSRFSFLYTIMRHDYHFNKDHGQIIFNLIINWIDENPLNCGPNYKCSQEISLRVLNWIFALNYYKNSYALTETIFQKIINSIYWQVCHIYNNINFSRIAVRNNHAITETLTLYIIGLLFPFFPDSYKWKIKGKGWFEEEIKYQIAPDGTYLQFSMNYHRVVVQLLTWAIVLAHKNGEQFDEIVYRRAYQSVNFLFQCQDESTGFLPNYGSNDGALFFKLNDNDYRDYRPQLSALHFILTGKSLYKDDYEDSYWYFNDGKASHLSFSPLYKQYGIISFRNGGYYLIREGDTFTFIRCGRYNNRPAHADNLHMDIWYKNENILFDGGSYKYNAADGLIKYFSGTESHNTVMLDQYDQMLKGSRFIWFYWSQALQISLSEQEDRYCFTGTVKCFTYINKKIRHIRKVTKMKGKDKWIIEDIIENKPADLKMRQIWHTKYPAIQLESDSALPVVLNGLYSAYYGTVEDAKQIEFITKGNTLKTNINAV
jgi:hypothetical protein